ncbi:MAG TPA: hypothetical protein VMK65_06930 [Longimicrobiales bacterium]|nr:hypothetical protein [Longimicrobiales bacterium]
MRSFRRLRPAAAGFLLLLACGDSTEPDREPLTAALLARASGESQSGTVATSVGTAPTVRATSRAGQPVPDVPVSFTVLAGGGSVAVSSARTDAAGLASAGSWTLGTLAGPNELRAMAPGLPPVSFHATALAGSAVDLTKVEGDAQEARIGGEVAASPAARLADAYGNPVSGAQVTFSVTEGGGSVVGGVAATDTGGVARVGAWRLGAERGNALRAEAVGVDPVTFTAHAFDPWNYIVSDEAPECPVGGPVFRVTEGAIAPLAQGNPLKKPRGMLLDGAGNLIVADGLAGLLRVRLSDGQTTVIAYGPPWSPRDVAREADGSWIVVEQPSTGGQETVGEPALYRITPAGQVSVVARGAPLERPHGLVLDPDGSYIVADNSAGLLRVTPQGQVSVIAAAAQGTAFASGVDVALDASGNYIVADGARGALLRVTRAGAVGVIHQGPPFSPPASQGARGPRGVVTDDNGDFLVVDYAARAVFRVTPGGSVSTTYQGDPLCAPADIVLEARAR